MRFRHCELHKPDGLVSDEYVDDTEVKKCGNSHGAIRRSSICIPITNRILEARLKCARGEGTLTYCGVGRLSRELHARANLPWQVQLSSL